MKKEWQVIYTPFALGSHRRGCDLGPLAVKHAGLTDALRDKGYSFSETTVDVISEESEKNKQLKNLPSVMETSYRLAQAVDETFQKERFPLIIGGDHSISIGSIAGVSTHYANLGVIWIDAHGDVNTDETTPSGNIHGMPLAANMGFGHDMLTSVYFDEIKVKPENVVILGARELDEGEIHLLKEQHITYYEMNTIIQKGLPEVMKEIANKFNENQIDGLHVSFDLDSLDESEAPGVGTPVKGGFSFQQASYILGTIRSWNTLTSCEFVEVNPLFDTQNKTGKVTVELIKCLL